MILLNAFLNQTVDIRIGRYEKGISNFGGEINVSGETKKSIIGVIK